MLSVSCGRRYVVLCLHGPGRHAAPQSVASSSSKKSSSSAIRRMPQSAYTASPITNRQRQAEFKQLVLDSGCVRRPTPWLDGNRNYEKHKTGRREHCPRHVGILPPAPQPLPVVFARGRRG
jgi:hypothetical protein